MGLHGMQPLPTYNPIAVDGYISWWQFLTSHGAKLNSRILKTYRWNVCSLLLTLSHQRVCARCLSTKNQITGLWAVFFIRRMDHGVLRFLIRNVAWFLHDFTLEAYRSVVINADRIARDKFTRAIIILLSLTQERKKWNKQT